MIHTKCVIDMTQIILHELTSNKALSLIKPGFYLAYVLSHEISLVLQRKLERMCNVTGGVPSQIDLPGARSGGLGRTPVVISMFSPSVLVV